MEIIALIAFVYLFSRACSNDPKVNNSARTTLKNNSGKFLRMFFR